MKAECAWCGKWKEVHAWQECVEQDYDGGEVHAPICKDCYEFVTGTCPELNIKCYNVRVVKLK